MQTYFVHVPFYLLISALFLKMGIIYSERRNRSKSHDNSQQTYERNVTWLDAMNDKGCMVYPSQVITREIYDRQKPHQMFQTNQIEGCMVYPFQVITKS